MSEPMTWGDYIAVRLLVALGSIVLFWVIAVGAWVLASARAVLHCSECDRRLVRRSGRLAPYEQRHYCPYHDPRER